MTMLALVALYLAYSCNKEENEINSEFKKELNFNANNTKIDYSGTIVKGHLIINIDIKDYETGKSIKENFDINTDKNQFPKEISEQITAKQKSLSSKFSSSEIRRLLNAMDKMVNSVTLDMRDSELKDLKMQGLFMCNSLIKSVNRQILKNDMILQKTNLKSSTNNLENTDSPIYTSNTVYEGYNRELSSFALTEDLVINVDDLQKYINEDTQNAEAKGFLFVQEILNNTTTNSISLYQLEAEIVEYTRNNPDDFEGQVSELGFRWPRGSDHGCCGNYSGPCYYFHPVCFLHDKMCTDCTPRWFCFSGCKPD